MVACSRCLVCLFFHSLLEEDRLREEQRVGNEGRAQVLNNEWGRSTQVKTDRSGVSGEWQWDRADQLADRMPSRGCCAAALSLSDRGDALVELEAPHGQLLRLLDQSQTSARGGTVRGATQSREESEQRQ